VSIAVSFIPVVGPLISCIVDGTFVDMLTAISSGDWAMVGMTVLGVVAGGAVGKMALKFLKAGQKSFALGGKSALGKKLIRGVKDITKKTEWDVSPEAAKNFRRLMASIDEGTGQGSWEKGLSSHRLFGSMSWSEKATEAVSDVGTREVIDRFSERIFNRAEDTITIVLP
jgi:hypothetical protein